MLVFKLGPGEHASREEIVEIVSERVGRSREWTRAKITPQIESALGSSLVADADGVLRTSNAATSWTLWVDPLEEDSDEP